MEKNLAKEKKELKTASGSQRNHESIVTEDSLELHDMSASKRRKYKLEQEKSKLKDLTFWRKVQYILTYYTWKFIAVIAACMIILFIIRHIYIATRPVALDLLLVNDPENTSFAETVTALYNNYCEVPDDARYLIDTSIQINPNADYSSANMAYETKMMAALTYDSTHIIICDAKVVDDYAKDGYIAELQHALPEDIFHATEHRLYECDGPVEDSRYYAIDISDMEFTKQTGIQLEEPYLCIPTCLSEENRETSYNFIRMILELEEH